MGKKEKGNFEFVKDKNDKKRNYIFQKDRITKRTVVFVIACLIGLIVAVVFSGVLFDYR